MKIVIGLIFIGSLLYGFDYHLKPVQVDKNVTCFFGKSEPVTKENGGEIANSCYVATIGGYVVIDSGPTYSFARQAYTAMQKLSPLDVQYVINTHKHDDHWLGNGFYKSIGAKIIGPVTLKNSVGKDEITRMQRVVSAETFAKTNIVYPDIDIEKTKNIKVGHTSFEIRQLSKKAHTAGDLIIYIPHKIIFTGDLVFNGRLLSLRDGDINGWLEALDKIEALDWKVLVSGHGRLTDRSALDMTRNYLTDLKKSVKKALDEDVELGEVTQKVKLEKYKDIPMYKLLNNLNILKAYQLLEFEEE